MSPSNDPPRDDAAETRDQLATASDSSSEPASQRPAVDAATPAQPAPKTIKTKPRTLALMAVVALAGITLVLWAWHIGPFNTPVVSTDNAYVRGQITVLAPQVSGYVEKVMVQDYHRVVAGQPLVQIDARIYRQRVAQAQAQLASAMAQRNNAAQAQAQNRATLGARRAALVAAQAEQTRARAELARVEELAAKGSVSLNERDRVRAATGLSNANVLRARADIEIGQQQIKSTDVSRGSLEAAVQAAQAQLELARIDLANTVVRAPRDGQVSEASVRSGQYVTAGSQLLFLVPDTLWVVANFKETQVGRMRVGQPATFAVDALEGATLAGHIEQIAPATGSEFSVLRPDNASGNFTKVVQRLPVRISIDPGQQLAQRLRPGMSVMAKVNTAANPERKR